MRRHHHRPTAPQSVFQGGNKISKAFTHTRTRFHHQETAVLQGLPNRARHSVLLGSIFKMTFLYNRRKPLCNIHKNSTMDMRSMTSKQKREEPFKLLSL